jgi:hypothetical protein
MPTVEIDPTPTPAGPPSAPYSGDEDVRNALGNVRDRLPSWVVLEEFRELAHAMVLDRLAKVYPTQIPTFEGPGLVVVRFAEAKLAAAQILEAVRVNLPDLGEAPEQLRADAFAALDDGVIGYPVGSDSAVDDDDDPSTPSIPVSSTPRVSSYTPLSAFPDPYAEARYGERYE